MKLAADQLVLDTNILVHLLRGKAAGQSIERMYGVGQRSPRAVISVVTKGELKALAYKFNWGLPQHERLRAMLASLPAADLANDLVQDAYARLDHASATMGKKMGKNDLWIAATTQIMSAVLLTTDRDFDHLHPDLVRVEYVELGAAQ